MPLTKDELLKPRYRVIADYFYNPYKIGDIITIEYEDRSVHLTTTHYSDEFGYSVNQANHFNPAQLKDFPHLFQPLPWWSDRKPDDMPEYVRYSEYYLNHYHLDGEFKNMIFKINNWSNGHYGIKAKGGGIIHGYEINYHPASEEEYTAYINQKQQ